MSSSDPNHPAQRHFWRGTTVVHWFVVVGVLLVLTSLPTAVLLPLVGADASNVPLLALVLVPVGPAAAAAVFAWSRFLEDRDDEPARHFLRGYRLNVLDALRVWVPVLAVLTVLAVNLANPQAYGLAGAFATGSVVVGVVVALWAMHALVISSLFSFRWRDVARLAAYYLVRSWRATLNAAALLVVVVGSVVLVSDWIMVFLAAPVTYFLVVGSVPMTEDVRRRFVAASQEPTDEE